MSNFIADRLEGLWASDPYGRPYSFDTVDQTWLNRIRRDVHLGRKHADVTIRTLSLKYFTRDVNPVEFVLFSQRLENHRRVVGDSSSSLEGGAMQTRTDIVRNGTVLKIGQMEYQMVPIPHKVSQPATSWDEYAMTIVSMLIKDNKGMLVESISPSVVDQSPLRVFMTTSSYIEFVASVCPLLNSWSVSGKGDKFCLSLREGYTRSPLSERHALRFMIYKLLGPIEIKLDVFSREVSYNQTNVTMKVESVVDNIADKDTKKVVARVPRAVPLDIKGVVASVPKGKKDKDNCAALMEFVGSRYPSCLLKALGYQGFPDKSQRLFMEIRPFIDTRFSMNDSTTTTQSPLPLLDTTSTTPTTAAVPLSSDDHPIVVADPAVPLSKWMKANGLESKIRVSAGPRSSGTLKPEEVPVLFEEYRKGMEPALDDKGKIKNALYFGRVEFCTDFWTHYKILMYRPSPSGVWMYCPISYCPRLPQSYASWKLQEIASSARMQAMLLSLIATLTKCVFLGTYMPRGSQYDGLCYPKEEREYQQIDMTGALDYDAPASGKFQKPAYATTQVTLDDGVEEKPISPPVQASFVRRLPTDVEKKTLKPVAGYDMIEPSLWAGCARFWFPNEKAERFTEEPEGYEIVHCQDGSFVVVMEGKGGYLVVDVDEFEKIKVRVDDGFNM